MATVEFSSEDGVSSLSTSDEILSWGKLADQHAELVPTREEEYKKYKKSGLKGFGAKVKCKIFGRKQSDAIDSEISSSELLKKMKSSKSLEMGNSCRQNSIHVIDSEASSAEVLKKRNKRKFFRRKKNAVDRELSADEVLKKKNKSSNYKPKIISKIISAKSMISGTTSMKSQKLDQSKKEDIPKAQSNESLTIETDSNISDVIKKASSQKAQNNDGLINGTMAKKMNKSEKADTLKVQSNDRVINGIDSDMSNEKDKCKIFSKTQSAKSFIDGTKSEKEDKCKQQNIPKTQSNENITKPNKKLKFGARVGKQLRNIFTRSKPSGKKGDQSRNYPKEMKDDGMETIEDQLEKERKIKEGQIKDCIGEKEGDESINYPNKINDDGMETIEDQLEKERKRKVEQIEDSSVKNITEKLQNENKIRKQSKSIKDSDENKIKNTIDDSKNNTKLQEKVRKMKEQHIIKKDNDPKEQQKLENIKRRDEKIARRESNKYVESKKVQVLDEAEKKSKNKINWGSKNKEEKMNNNTKQKKSKISKQKVTKKCTETRRKNIVTKKSDKGRYKKTNIDRKDKHRKPAFGCKKTQDKVIKKNARKQKTIVKRIPSPRLKSRNKNKTSKLEKKNISNNKLKDSNQDKVVDYNTIRENRKKNLLRNKKTVKQPEKCKKQGIFKKFLNQFKSGRHDQNKKVTRVVEKRQRKFSANYKLSKQAFSHSSTSVTSSSISSISIISKSSISKSSTSVTSQASVSSASVKKSKLSKQKVTKKCTDTKRKNNVKKNAEKGGNKKTNIDWKDKHKTPEFGCKQTRNKVIKKQASKQKVIAKTIPSPRSKSGNKSKTSKLEKKNILNNKMKDSNQDTVVDYNTIRENRKKNLLRNKKTEKQPEKCKKQGIFKKFLNKFKSGKNDQKQKITRVVEKRHRKFSANYKLSNRVFTDSSTSVTSQSSSHSSTSVTSQSSSHSSTSVTSQSSSHSSTSVTSQSSSHSSTSVTSQSSISSLSIKSKSSIPESSTSVTSRVSLSSASVISHLYVPTSPPSTLESSTLITSQPSVPQSSNKLDSSSTKCQSKRLSTHDHRGKYGAPETKNKTLKCCRHNKKCNQSSTINIHINLQQQHKGQQSSTTGTPLKYTTSFTFDGNKFEYSQDKPEDTLPQVVEDVTDSKSYTGADTKEKEDVMTDHDKYTGDKTEEAAAELKETSNQPANVNVKDSCENEKPFDKCQEENTTNESIVTLVNEHKSESVPDMQEKTIDRCISDLNVSCTSVTLVQNDTSKSLQKVNTKSKSDTDTDCMNVNFEKSNRTYSRLKRTRKMASDRATIQKGAFAGTLEKDRSDNGKNRSLNNEKEEEVHVHGNYLGVDEKELPTNEEKQKTSDFDFQCYPKKIPEGFKNIYYGKIYEREHRKPRKICKTQSTQTSLEGVCAGNEFLTDYDEIQQRFPCASAVNKRDFFRQQNWNNKKAYRQFRNIPTLYSKYNQNIHTDGQRGSPMNTIDGQRGIPLNTIDGQRGAPLNNLSPSCLPLMSCMVLLPTMCPFPQQQQPLCLPQIGYPEGRWSRYDDVPSMRCHHYDGPDL